MKLLLLWLAISVPVFLGGDDPFPLTQWWLKLAAVAILGVAVVVADRRPALAAAIPAALALATSPDLFSDHLAVAQVVLAFLLGRRAPRMRTGLLFFASICLASLLRLAITPAAQLSTWFAAVATALLMIILPWLAGRYARQHDELVRTGWELAERLEREHDLISDRTRLLERSRIASDMHDSLGHELSLVALRAAALQVTPDLPAPARQAASELRESAAQATDRLHELIAVLRTDGVPVPVPVLPADDTVNALVHRATASGMKVTLTGSLQQLPPLIDRAVYRVVQEGLTNAAKHAPGAAVAISQEMSPTEARITISNPKPPGAPPASPSGGYGLTSLNERVRLAGGRLTSGPSNGTFHLTAHLPLSANTAATPLDSKRKLALARRKVRRSLIDAVAVVSGLALLLFGYDFYTAQRSVLDPAVYEDLRPGDPKSGVESRIPEHQSTESRPRSAPPDPPGTDECRFYRVTVNSLSPAYRLCFTDESLSHKHEIRLG